MASLIIILYRTDKCKLNKAMLSSYFLPKDTVPIEEHSYSKNFLSDHSKVDKTKVFKTNGSLLMVESIAECSLGAFCNTFDLH